MAELVRTPADTAPPKPVASYTDASFRVMGSASRLLVGPGDEALVARLRQRLDALEGLWSRFRADSEVSTVNAHAGRPVMVSPDTLRLFEHARAAWEITEGWFDPTMLDELESLGYDRTHERLDGVTGQVPALPGRAADVPPDPAASPMADLEVDLALGAVTIPAGVRFDPGGIGKGLAADLVATEAVAQGAERVLVDLGGDVRVAGPWFTSPRWPVLIADPYDIEVDLAVVSIVGGAVATSSRVRRRWRTSSGAVVHHLLDPRTRRPAETDLVSVSVHAGAAWFAEVVAKAALIGGSTVAEELVERTATAALCVTDTGEVRVFGPLDVHLVADSPGGRP
ncbi:MAG: FAD:protein FMN transferase [Actinomyces sp.]|nr:MAG: FAD:protein FMN transferase [Actinomyces sp.]